MPKFLMQHFHSKSFCRASTVTSDTCFSPCACGGDFYFFFDWSYDVDECEGCRFPSWHVCRQQGPYSCSKVSHTNTAGTLQSLSACHITSAHAHYAHIHPCPKHPHEPNLCAKTHTHTHRPYTHSPPTQAHTCSVRHKPLIHPTLSQQTQSKTLLTGSVCKHTSFSPAHTHTCTHTASAHKLWPQMTSESKKKQVCFNRRKSALK